MRMNDDRQKGPNQIERYPWAIFYFNNKMKLISTNREGQTCAIRMPNECLKKQKAITFKFLYIGSYKACVNINSMHECMDALEPFVSDL